MSIPSNRDFTDYDVAKSFINKSLDTGLEKEKNKELGAAILKVFKNLWHKTEVTFRQLCSSFEEGWITNDTIKNRLITKIGEFKDEIDALSRNKGSLESSEEVDELFAKMKKAQSDMRVKITKMQTICKLFRKRGDETSAKGIENQLTALETKVGEMLDPLKVVANLKDQIKQLDGNKKELREALQKHLDAEAKVARLQQANPELVNLRRDLKTAQFQKKQLEDQLAVLAAEKKTDPQKEEITERLRGLDKLLSESTEQIKQFVSDNKQLKAANVELAQALEGAQRAEEDYKKLIEAVGSERKDFLQIVTSSLNIIESDLKANERKLQEKDKKIADKDKKIADKDKKIADLESQLAVTKKMLQEARRAEFDEKWQIPSQRPQKPPLSVKVSPESRQSAYIQAGIEREKGPIIEAPPGIEGPPVEEFPRVTDVTRLDKLSTAMLKFIRVAQEKNLILNDPRLGSIYEKFTAFEDDTLVHAVDFFKEVEGRLVRLGMAKWNADKTGIKIKKVHPEVKEAYKKALKAFYKIEGAEYAKDVLPALNERRRLNAEHLRSQREKINLIDTHFVANLEEAITTLGNAMQKLVRATEKSGLPVVNLSDIEAMAKGPWNMDLDTVDHATQIFTGIEDSLVKQGTAKRDKNRVGVTIDKQEYPKLEKAYEKALAAFDAHIGALHEFYVYDDLIFQNNEKLSQLIAEAKNERGDEVLEYIEGGEELLKYDQIVNKFVEDGIEMSDKDILGLQREILEAIKERYRIDEFPPDSDIAKFYKEADDGVNHLEFTKNRHEGFRRGAEIKDEEVRERRIEERTQKFEREFPSNKIKKSIYEQAEKPVRRDVPRDKYADYESRHEDIQFKDPRKTSKDHRKFLRKEAERSTVSVEQKHVLKASHTLNHSIEQLDKDLKSLVKTAREKNAIGHTGWSYNDSQFELLERSPPLSRENVLIVASDYVFLLKEEFVAAKVAVRDANGKDIVFNKDADSDLIFEYNTVLKDIEGVKEGMAELKGIKEVKKLAKLLKSEIEKALTDLIEAAEANGMPMANPLFEDEFPDPAQDLAKFKKKGLKVKNDSLAFAANNVFDKIRVALEDAGIDEKDPKIVKAFNHVCNLLEKLEKREGIHLHA